MPDPDVGAAEPFLQVRDAFHTEGAGIQKGAEMRDGGMGGGRIAARPGLMDPGVRGIGTGRQCQTAEGSRRQNARGEGGRSMTSLTHVRSLGSEDLPGFPVGKYSYCADREDKQPTP
ncbi:hypothetical protein GCM10010289_20850 [Streptomyces violascens]|uniref:Uncharacterized protein n=1 Tax=Streptomyces violascens TaxID=67381 RepID=A0ABQ3QEZ0_9ACTN|nr:hypothetical protein GCM10010289_20850 [Streptomyces violascens]GHI35787.1 hypothetical protein Sviol_01950 [Streptomyces violascens]